MTIICQWASRTALVWEFASWHLKDPFRECGELCQRVLGGWFLRLFVFRHWRCSSARALASVASDGCYYMAGEFFVHHALAEDGCCRQHEPARVVDATVVEAERLLIEVAK
jgi:hypothetical protein